MISDETDELLDTGAGVAKALPLFENEPFFTYNSDSLWVEGMGTSLHRMQSRWNPDTMDALMLLAPCATAIGYDGRGDFEMDAWGQLETPAGNEHRAVCLDRCSDRATGTVRGGAAGPLLDKSAVGQVVVGRAALGSAA